MNDLTPPDARTFTEEQKQYLQGFMAGVQQKVSFTGGAVASKATESTGTPAPSSVHGTPIDDLVKEERIKLEEHPFSIRSRMEASAAADRFPEGGDVFRYKFHGLFYVTPAEEALMLRCRIPGGILSATQFAALASLAEEFGDGHLALTTRSNVQIRGIAPRFAVEILDRLAEAGLTSRGAGADNVRNITISPTSGIDPREVCDVRPFARKLHHRILNDLALYDLPRKFNVAFDNGGSTTALADTNDVGFYPFLEAGEVRFRLYLGGVTGHRAFAEDASWNVLPEDAVPLTVAILRAFSEKGDRTNRKKARLNDLLGKIGIPAFMDEVFRHLGRELPVAKDPPPLPLHGHLPSAHLGVHPQKQAGLHWVGVAIPVGRLSASTARALAAYATTRGNGTLRLTVWQNLLIEGVPEGSVSPLKKDLLELGLSCEPSTLASGLVACTGNKGCKFAASDTKGTAMATLQALEGSIRLRHPINLHFTGCAHSCAQHYVGDIGLIATKIGAESTEGFHVFVGGGFEAERGVARELLRDVPSTEVPARIGEILRLYQTESEEKVAFTTWIRSLDLDSLRSRLAPLETPA